MRPPLSSSVRPPELFECPSLARFLAQLRRSGSCAVSGVELSGSTYRCRSLISAFMRTPEWWRRSLGRVDRDGGRLGSVSDHHLLRIAPRRSSLRAPGGVADVPEVVVHRYVLYSVRRLGWSQRIAPLSDSAASQGRIHVFDLSTAAGLPSAWSVHERRS